MLFYPPASRQLARPKSTKMMGPTTLLHILIATIPLVSCLPHPPVEHLARRSAFPTTWYHRREHNVHSLFRRQESDVDQLPVVGSPGTLCSVTFSHRLNINIIFIDEFNVLQNGPPNGLQQTLMRQSLSNGLMPSKTRFRPALSPTSPFLP